MTARGASGRTSRCPADKNLLEKIRGELVDIRATFEPGKADAVGLTVRGVQIIWDAKKQTLTCKGVTAPLKPEGGRVRLRVLVDRGSIEVFGNDGAVALSVGGIVPEKERSLSLFARGGAARISVIAKVNLRPRRGNRSSKRPRLLAGPQPATGPVAATIALAGPRPTGPARSAAASSARSARASGE